MGYLAVFLSAVLAGINPPVLKYALTHLSPVVLMLSRYLVALLILGSYYVFKYKKASLKTLKTGFPISLFSSLSLLLIIFGINLTTISSTQAILAFIPICVGFGSHFILKEKTNGNQLIGIILGFIGTLLIIFHPYFYATENLNVGSVEGNILVLLAAIFSSVYVLLSRKYKDRLSPLDLTFANLVSGVFVFYLSFLVIKFVYPASLLSTFTPEAIRAVMYLGVFGTVIFFILYQYGINKTNAIVVGLSQYVQFPITIGLGIAFFGDTLTPLFIVASTLILFGAYLGSKSPKNVKTRS